MAAVDAGTIYSEVRIELDKLRADLAKAESRFDQFGKQNQQQSNTVKKRWTDSFKQINLAGVAAFAGIGLAVRGAIRTFADFEQQLANVRSVAGATPEEFERIEAAAREAGETTRFTASQAADALYNLASAGFDATQSTDALNGVLLLAQATGSDLASSSQAVTATLSQYGMEASEAADVSNIFAAAITNSQANMGKLSSALRQAGPVAGSLGISLEETTGALQALFDAGFQGEQAGTALRNILGSLANETDPVVQKLGEMGIAFEDLNPATNSFTEIIGTLSEAGLEAGDVFKAFGREVGPQLLSLLQTGEKGLIAYTKAVTGTNKAAEAAEIQNDTLQGSIDRLKSTVEAATIQLVDNFEPVLRAVVDAARQAVAIFSAIPQPLQIAIGLFAAAIPVVGGLAVAAGALGGALAFITGPIGIAIGGISLLTGGIVALKNRINETRTEQLAQDFGDLSESTGVAAEQVEAISDALARGSFGNFGDAAEQVQALAENLGVTREQVINIGLANENISDQYREQLQTLKDQLIADRERFSLNDALTEKQRIRAQLAEEEKQSIVQAAEVERNREREAELAAAREQARVEGVVEARKTAETEYQESVRSTQELQRLGFLDTEQANDRLIAANNRLIETLSEIGYSGLRGEFGDQALLDAIERVKQLTAENEQLANSQESVNDTNRDAVDVALDYGRRLQDLIASEEEAIELERQRAIASVLASGSSADAIEIATHAINRFYDQLQANRDADIGQLGTWAQEYQSEVSAIVGAATNLFSQLDALQQAQAQAQIDRLNRQLQVDLEIIDARLQAELEAAGVAEETKIERLQRELEEAKKKGDEEQVLTLTNAIKRTEIEEEYAEKRTQAEEEFQEKQAQLEYKAALASWRYKLAAAIANAAQAITSIWAQWAANPVFAGVLTGISATATGVQIAAMNEAKPVKPEFQTGGLVLPSNGNNVGDTGTDVRVAENGASELLFNSGPEGREFIEAFSQALADRLQIYVPLTLDGKVIA
ncbi:MAG: phage tail tape measure protein, partial [Anaerovoracaceae bacterium]